MDKLKAVLDYWQEDLKDFASYDIQERYNEYWVTRYRLDTKETHQCFLGIDINSAEEKLNKYLVEDISFYSWCNYHKQKRIK